MDADRWRRVNEIFHDALDRLPARRPAYLDAACDGDDELRGEVESLLAAHEQAGDFIATPAYELGGGEMATGKSAGVESAGDQPTSDEGAAARRAQVVGPPPAASSLDEILVGRRLGPYQIHRRLGEGGMGVVYQATDTRLGRSVAIKSLAHHLLLDERSRRRLRREAMAAAALSHPGIATVFALEEYDGHPFIVYEFADGPTLREELGAGAYRLPTLAATGLAIARALAAAHALGIVHRDLKPENVIRTGDGVKILDFGLAIFQQPPLVAVSTGSRLTLPGTLVGTPSYMAPEQLCGREVDFRADQFSFGVLFYELACGVHPFEGENPASTIARVIEVDPEPLVVAGGSVPPALERILERCLSKDPRNRYPHTEALVADLEALSEEAAVASPEEAVSPRPSPPSAAALSPHRGRLAWWRCHQLVVGFGYFILLYPLWLVRTTTESGATPSGIGAVLFFVALVPIVFAGFLRIHLAFASRFYPEQLGAQRRRAIPLVRAAELVLALLLLAGGAAAGTPRPWLGAVLVGVAIGLPVLSSIIEPTTARAAFPAEGGVGGSSARSGPTR